MATSDKNKAQNGPQLLTRAGWKELGFSVPKKALPAKIETYRVPNYRSVYRDRHLFSSDQVNPVSAEMKIRRSQIALKGVRTKMNNMERGMEQADLTIENGKSEAEIFSLAYRSHGGNYLGNIGEFHWSNKKARNAIRHCLTNYESLWSKTNRGATGAGAYDILRHRVDELVDATYPQFAEGMPEVANPQLY